MSRPDPNFCDPNFCDPNFCDPNFCDPNFCELAQKLEISEALVSKILRYQFTEFTIDRQRSYLEKPGIKYEFRRVA